MKMEKKARKWMFILLTLTALSAGAGLVTWFAPERAPVAQAMAASSVPGSFAELAKKASPSVVNISTVKVVKGQGVGPMPMPFGQGDPFRDFFERFFRDQLPKDYRQQSLGTGFVIDKEGHILTNNHVVEMADAIKVKCSDGKEYEAKTIGRDPKTDLALIKIESDESLKPLPLGDSEKLEVGDWVVAIGNPFGLGNTVTAGIVSAKYRQIGSGSYDNYIQTDASINPGNSGGPLLDTNGTVVGINTAIFSQSGGNIGIGFAIPVNMARELLPQLKKGKVIRGWLGVMIQKITPELKDEQAAEVGEEETPKLGMTVEELTPELAKNLGLTERSGIVVVQVEDDSPAAAAGLRPGDVILEIDQGSVKSLEDFNSKIEKYKEGDTILLLVKRRGATVFLTLKVSE
jgi:serine protease Do